MALVKDLFGEAVAPAPRTRKSVCTRNPDAGAGSCWHWWESCPGKIADCYSREIRAIGERHGTPGGEIPDAMRADIAKMDVRRRKALGA